MLYPSKSNVPGPKSRGCSAQPDQTRADAASGSKSLKPALNKSYISLCRDQSSVLQLKKTFSKGQGTPYTSLTLVEDNEQHTVPEELKPAGKTETQDDDDLLHSEHSGSVDEDIEQGDGDGQANTRNPSQHADEVGEKLKHELSKYKQELREYNETTRALEMKYMRINSELSEMQQQHEQFVGRHSIEELGEEKNASVSYITSSTSFGSNTTLMRKHSSVYPSSSGFPTMHDATRHSTNAKKSASAKIRHQLGGQVDGGAAADSAGDGSSHFMETLQKRYAARRTHNPIEQEQDSYHVLKNVINTKRHSSSHKFHYEQENASASDFHNLYSTIENLKSDRIQCRDIIRQQQERIVAYHTRCVKAQEIMKTQKHEIDKLHGNNKQLEASIYKDIENLRTKITSKLNSVAKLPLLLREERSKYEKVLRENCQMAEKLDLLQEEAKQLRTKIDELNKRRTITVNRLKAAERDLKIFKNYNATLKAEKHRMSNDLNSMKQELDALQLASKRNLTRHREQTDKQRRELQKRIYDLEAKLNRSQNSTSGLIQERDSLISELQTQLHTLVHNFEISQKHIRVLRRHIYTMTSTRHHGAGIPTADSEPGVPRVASTRIIRTSRNSH